MGLRRQDTYAVAGLLALLVVSLAESLARPDVLLVACSLLLAASSEPTVALLLLRLSVMYQPEPLKTMPTGWKTRRTAPAQDGQVRSGSSLKDWNCSNCAPHVSQA